VTVLAAGMDGPSELKVVRADLGKVDQSGKLLIDLAADIRQSLFLEFEERYDGPIELTAVSVVGGAAP